MCPDAVYVWTYSTDSFQVLFQRDPALTNQLQSAKITNVQVEGDWAILQSFGLDAATQSVQGFFQFYNIKLQRGTVLPGQAAALCQYREDDIHPPCTILSFAHKKANTNEIDMSMLEAGPQKDAQGNNLSGFTKKQFTIPVNPSIAQKEFPMFMSASSKFGFTYMMTRSGMLYVYDIGSAYPIYQVNVCGNGCFAMTHAINGEMVLAATDGNVYKLEIDENQIVDFIMSRLGKSDAAFKLAMRANLRGADQLFQA